MATSLVLGSTGATGSQILSTLLTTTTTATTTTISRRLPETDSPNLRKIQEANISNWPSLIRTLTPPPTTLFSALGSSSAAAGSIANQWKIDHDLVIDTAKAAREAGTKTVVFISSVGTRNFLIRQSVYGKMKNGVEDALKEMGFETVVVVKPGLIVGGGKAPWLENFVGGLWNGVQDRLGQHKLVIGRAAVAAARIAGEGKAPEKYWVLGPADIVRLGRDEWVEE
ncbi:protein fmp52-2, mitochondrial [Aspergillus crustosus]